ncbi:MAG: hypothetical protein ACHQ50_03185 [Fimbriimonadales bacterium]
MKTIHFAALAFATIVALHATAFGQVNNIHIQRHPNRISKAQDSAMIAAARDAHQAHLAMKAALPIYDGHRVLAMELCSLADRDIKEGLRGIPAAPAANFSLRKPLKANKNREKPLLKYSAAQIQASNAQMQSAVPMIQAALQALSKAAGDYGGYRTQAASSLNQALQQIQICLQLRGGGGVIRP